MLRHMKLGMSLEQSQSMRQTQRPELKQELVQKMGYHIENVRDAGPDSPDSLLQGVIDGILGAIDDDNLREGLRTLFSDETFREKILNYAALLAAPTPERVRDVVLNYFYNIHRGEFAFEDAEEEKHEEGRAPRVVSVQSYARFREAFISPNVPREKIEESIKLWLPEQKASGGDPIGAKRVMDESAAALIAADFSRPHVDILIQALDTVLKKRESGAPGLTDFLRDVAIMGKLDFVVSERIQRRFADRFSKAGWRTSPESMQNAFLNAVGEYALVSMGVVYPNLFQLNRGVRDTDAYENAKDSFADAGLDLDEVLRQSNLQGQGTFFMHRWKTIERKPSHITDDLIREFITQTVRADSERILEAADYKTLFEKARSICAEGRSGDKDKEDVMNDLCTELADTIASEPFEEAIIDLIRNKWYAKLDIFYAPTA